jgi:sugar/nucleoside kinase (ribokinase family)
MTEPRIYCLGTLVLDRVVEIDRLPGPDDKVFVKAKREAAGGPARNVADALATWGNPVSIASAVGDDLIGRHLIARLGEAGIDASATRLVAGFETATTIILVESSGERAIIIDPVPDEILQAIGANLAPVPGDAVVSNLFHRTATAEALRRTGQIGALTLLDLEWPEIDRWGWEAAKKAASQAGIVATNSQVLRAFAGSGGVASDLDSAWALANALQPAGERVCVTLGAGGVLAREGSRRLFVPALAVKPRDTTGAGDRFLAALTRALLAGAAFEAALRLATAAAGLHIAGEPHGWSDVEIAAGRLKALEG